MFTYKLPTAFRKCCPLNIQHVSGSCRQPLGLIYWSLSAGPVPGLLRNLFRGKDRGVKILVVPQICKVLHNDLPSGFEMEGPGALEIFNTSPKRSRSPKHWAHAKEHIQEAGPDTETEFFLLGTKVLGAERLIQEALFWSRSMEGIGLGQSVERPSNSPADGGVYRAIEW